MKKGRKYDDGIDNHIIAILRDKKVATPETVRKEYNVFFGKLLSWITVKRHLENLAELGVLIKKTISKGNKRELVIYTIK